jgi:hypothetical protein
LNWSQSIEARFLDPLHRVFGKNLLWKSPRQVDLWFILFCHSLVIKHWGLLSSMNFCLICWPIWALLNQIFTKNTIGYQPKGFQSLHISLDLLVNLKIFHMRQWSHINYMTMSVIDNIYHMALPEMKTSLQDKLCLSLMHCVTDQTDP